MAMEVAGASVDQSLARGPGQHSTLDFAICTQESWWVFLEVVAAPLPSIKPIQVGLRFFINFPISSPR